jgi:nucleotidyltransferase/DNA polymerase involved in DNA repair
MSSRSELQQIPGVGPSISQDLHDLGILRVRDLRDGDPDELYQRLCAIRGATIDRCVLYVFRGAVYFASNEDHDPRLLKWWSWKD